MIGLNRQLEQTLEINSNDSHYDSQDGDKKAFVLEDGCEKLDAKYLVQKLTLDASKLDLYKRATQIEVTNVADVMLSKAEQLQNCESHESESDFDLPPIEFNEFWHEMPDELKKDPVLPAQVIVSEPELNLLNDNSEMIKVRTDLETKVDRIERDFAK